MTENHRQEIIDAILERLGRYARGTVTQRKHLIEELTHVLSCQEVRDER